MTKHLTYATLPIRLRKGVGYLAAETEGEPGTETEINRWLEGKSPHEVFSAWCDWEGLISYGTTLWVIVSELLENEL